MHQNKEKAKFQHQHALEQCVMAVIVLSNLNKFIVINQFELVTLAINFVCHSIYPNAK